MLSFSYALLRTRPVQTWLAGKVVTLLSGYLGMSIQIGGVDISLSKGIVLEKFFISDNQGDSLIYVNRLYAIPALLEWDSTRVHIHSAELSGGCLHLIKHKGDSLINIEYLIDKLTGKDTTDTAMGWTLSCTAMRLTDIHFFYRNMNDSMAFDSKGKSLRQADSGAIDFANPEFSLISAELTDFMVNSDTVSFHLVQSSLNSTITPSIHQLSTVSMITGRQMEFLEIILKTGQSEVHGQLKFRYDDFSQFSSFENTVWMEAVFDTSVIHPGDLAKFSTSLKKMIVPVRFSGKAYGTVNDLKGQKFYLEYGDKTRLTGNFGITGLPEINNTYIYLKVKQLRTTAEDIEKFSSGLSSGRNGMELPLFLKHLNPVSFSGEFTGFYYDFVAYGNFTSPLGFLSSDISFRHGEDGRMMFSGNLKSREFNAGKLFESEELLGKITMNAHLTGSGSSLENTEVDITGKIATIELNRYIYRDAGIKGRLSSRTFDGEFTVHDENIDLDFSGQVDFAKSPPLFNFQSAVRHANLARLNLVSPDSSLSLSVLMDINLAGKSLDDLQGTAIFRDIQLTKNNHVHPLGNLIINSSYSNDYRTVLITSDFADAEMAGRFSFSTLPGSIRNILSSILPTAIRPVNEPSRSAQHFYYAVSVKNTSGLSAVFYPDLLIPAGAKLSGTLNDSVQEMVLNGKIPALTLYGTRHTDWTFNMSIEKKSLGFNASCQRISYSDSIFSENINFIVNGKNDTLRYDMYWGANPYAAQPVVLNRSLIDNNGAIKGSLDFTAHPVIKNHNDPSYISIADTVWNIAAGQTVQVDTGGAEIRNLTVSTGNQYLKINGMIDRNPASGLSVLLGNFSIANFRPALEPAGVHMDGTVFGNLMVSHLLEVPVMSANLLVNNFSYNGDTLGNGAFIIYWTRPDAPVSIAAELYRGKLKTIVAKGYYDAQAASDKLNISIAVDKLKIFPLEQVLGAVFTRIDGVAVGNLSLRGTLQKPVLTGELMVQRARFNIDYLKTRYSFAHAVTFKENCISIRDLMAYDMKGNHAIVNGDVYHNYFSDFRYDFTVETKNLHCLNTTYNQNELYYGQAFGSGICKITGNVKNTTIDISARTDKGTQIFIPLSGTSEVSESGYITFRKPLKLLSDTAGKPDSLAKQKFVADLSGIQLNFNLEVTPDAEVQIIFDEKIGDIIKGRGNGNLKMNINTLGDFNMYGDYYLEKGDYLFTLKNVINKRFAVEKGGTIHWEGDPYDADIDLWTVYSLRASLSDLRLPGLTDSTGNRVPVDCRLHLSDKLMNPAIGFAIDLPGADESYKTHIRTLSQSEQELNKQVFSLLVLGRFLPLYDPEGDDNSDAPGSGWANNSTEVLSNQLSNWLSRISDDVDIGVKYRPGDQISGNDLEVALSTQLFNDRLSVNGNVGTTGNQSTSEIVGDVNLEYMLTKDGKFRVKAFYDSNDYTKLADNAPDKQGVGISYRREFNTLKELFKREKKKEEVKAD